MKVTIHHGELKRYEVDVEMARKREKYGRDLP